MSGAGINLNWFPPGPVSAAFLLDPHRVRAIMGPIGAGKTSSCLFDIIHKAAQQEPSRLDGVRYYKAAVIRDTYRQLELTTIPSWHAWVPRTVGEWSGDKPPQHRVRFRLGDGSQVDLVVEFIALGEHRVEDVMRGWEGSHAYVNEADRLPEDVLTFVQGRLGRYPNAKHGLKRPGERITLDFNAPDDDSWLYRRLVADPQPGARLFVQPSGFAAEAENLANLPPGYYRNASAGQPDWYVRRFIENRWGYSREGRPVFPEFVDALHVASEEIQAMRGVQLTLGADFGLTPAVAVTQQLPDGRWHVLDELVTGRMGAQAMGKELAQLLVQRFPDHAGPTGGSLGGTSARWRSAEPAIRGYGDPTGNTPAPTDERTCFEILRATTALSWGPAASNALQRRLEVVRAPLLRLIDGKPGLLLSPRCKVLRKAFNSGYRLKRLQVQGERFADLPEKNEWSHIMDALQYALLGGGEYQAVLGRQRQDAQAWARHPDADGDYDPLEVG